MKVMQYLMKQRGEFVIIFQTLVYLIFQFFDNVLYQVVDVVFVLFIRFIDSSWRPV